MIGYQASGPTLPLDLMCRGRDEGTASGCSPVRVERVSRVARAPRAGQSREAVVERVRDFAPFYGGAVPVGALLPWMVAEGWPSPAEGARVLAALVRSRRIERVGPRGRAAYRVRG